MQVVVLDWAQVVVLGWVQVVVLGWVQVMALDWVQVMALDWVQVVALGWVQVVTLGWYVLLPDGLLEFLNEWLVVRTVVGTVMETSLVVNQPLPFEFYRRYVEDPATSDLVLLTIALKVHAFLSRCIIH